MNDCRMMLRTTAAAAVANASVVIRLLLLLPSIKPGEQYKLCDGLTQIDCYLMSPQVTLF